MIFDLLRTLGEGGDAVDENEAPNGRVDFSACMEMRGPGQHSELEDTLGIAVMAEAQIPSIESTLSHVTSEADLPVPCDVGAAI